MNAGYWLTHAAKTDPRTEQEYKRTHLYEVQFGVQPTHKWRLTTNLARSDRDEQNDAWMFGAQYGRYSKDVPHTWATVLNIGRCGRESYIKSGYDMKNDDYGGKGLEWYYMYVPRKNVVASFRYMLIEPLEPTDALHNYRQEEYRGEIDWYF